MEIIGRIQNLKDAWTIARAIEFDKTVKSNYAPNRLERWYRWGSNLQSIPYGRHKLTYYGQPHYRLIELGNSLLPDWTSLLCCYGDHVEGTSTDIGDHRDHGFTQGETIMLNLGIADFTIDGVTHRVEDGVVVRFNSKQLHSAKQVSNLRYNFTWRRVKPEVLNPYLQTELF
jgi:hypothetical protein